MLAKAGPSCLKPESEKSFADRSSRIRQALSAICAANPAAPWSPRPLAPHTHVARGGIGVRREPLPPLWSGVPDSSAVWRSAEGARPAVELARSWPKAAPASGPRALDDTSKYVSEWLRRRPSQSRRKRSMPIPLPAMSSTARQWVSKLADLTKRMTPSRVNYTAVADEKTQLAKHEST